MSLHRARLSTALLAVVVFLSVLIPNVYAATQATSFCKCACSTNSTIIALNPPPGSGSKPSSSSPDGKLLRRYSSPSGREQQPAFLHTLLPRTSLSSTSFRRRSHKRDAPVHHLTCLDCNRSFCHSHLSSSSLCKNAPEEEIFATCFQRDSLKDMIIVWVFVVGTLSLVGWAVGREAWDLYRSGGGLKGLTGKNTGGIPGGGGGGGERSAAPGGGDGYVRVGQRRDNGHSREVSGFTDASGVDGVDVSALVTGGDDYDDDHHDHHDDNDGNGRRRAAGSGVGGGRR